MVRIPFKDPIHWGSGVRSGPTRLIVELVTNTGIQGWGETICLLPFIRPVLEQTVIPLALNTPISEVEKLHRRVLGAGYYHHKRAAVMALAAVEMAMWDARGQAAGQPLWALWGGRYRHRVEACAYLFFNKLDPLRAQTRQFVDRGFTTFKIKIGGDPHQDIAQVATVRDVIGDQPLLRADVNGAWTPGTARRQLEKLKPYDLAYIEQPLEMDDLSGHVHLRQAQSIPVALDESAYTLTDIGNIVRLGAADVILLDPHELGGLWPCVKAAALAEAVGIPVTLHSGGELGLSQAAYLHLAASIPNLSLAIDTEHDYLDDDIAIQRPCIEEGHFAVPEGPGLGVTVDRDKIARYQTDTIEGAYLDPERPDWFPEKPQY